MTPKGDTQLLQLVHVVPEVRVVPRAHVEPSLERSILKRKHPGHRPAATAAAVAAAPQQLRGQRERHRYFNFWVSTLSQYFPDTRTRTHLVFIKLTFG